MSNYPTPHINATPEDFAPTVIMPGDPLRSRFIAENFLTGARLVNDVRGVQGYTGTYRGERVSVMASGMGIPSMGIYSYELFSVFGVENIIRVGSCGSMREEVAVRDLVIALSSSTDSNYPASFGVPGTLAPTASFDLVRSCVEEAEARGARYHVGNVLCSDVFYASEGSPTELTPAQRWGRMGALCVEMESAALYLNAARAGKRALALFTVSDSLLTGEATTAEERQTTFTEMIEIALEVARKAAK